MDTNPPLSEQRVREIVREEIEWALKIARPVSSRPPAVAYATPAAERRAQRDYAILESFKAGASVPDCAARHGVHAQTVYRTLALNGVDHRTAKLARYRAIVDDYEAGLSIIDCAAKHECTPDTVSHALRACGVKPRGRSERPAKDNPRTARMIEMRANGSTLEEIGAEFKITRERVRQILHKEGVSTTAEDRPITPEQRAAVEEYVAEHGNMAFYASKFGVDRTVFRNWVLRCGHVPHDKGRKLNPLVKARSERVAQLYLDGVPVEEIARRIGFNHTNAVYLDLGRAGIKPQRQRSLGNVEPA